LIRQATAHDRAAMQRLYEALRPGQPVKVIASRLEEINEHPHHTLLVHTTDGVVDGSVFVSCCPDPMFGTLPFAVADHLIVAGTASFDDVGRKLILAAEEAAREHRCTKLIWLSREQHAGQAILHERGYHGATSALEKTLHSE